MLLRYSFVPKIALVAGTLLVAVLTFTGCQDNGGSSSSGGNSKESHEGQSNKSSSTDSQDSGSDRLAGGSGGIDSSGGDAVALNDDTVVLADPFYRPAEIQGTFECNAGEQGYLNDRLLAELKRSTTLLVRYGAAGRFPDGFDPATEGVS